jgi:hypothetical protein
MDLPDDFVCAVCIETLFTRPLKRCMGCGKAFHKVCILKWLKTQSSETSCPCCRCSPMMIMDDQYLEQIFVALQNNLLAVCKFCRIRVSTQEILSDHYALCSAYQRKLSKQISQRGEFLWELLSKSTPQIAFDFKYPTGEKPFIRAEINVPDRRESPQTLLFVLFVRKNAKRPNEYLFDIGLADEQHEAPRFPVNLGAILAFCREELHCEVRALKHAKQIKLFKVTSSRPSFRMWIYVF